MRIVGDEPVPGYYATRLVKGGPLVAVKIERTTKGYVATVDGRRSSIDAVWPACGRRLITRETYGIMRRRAGWHRAAEPEHPLANPKTPVDLRKMKPIAP